MPFVDVTDVRKATVRRFGRSDPMCAEQVRNRDKPSRQGRPPSQGRDVPLPEVAVPRELFAAILCLIGRLPAAPSSG